MISLNDLPENLPVPEDDGLSKHLVHQNLPSLLLNSTNATQIDLSALNGWVVIYCYPRTGKPGEPLPEGWDLIPGARGCTPQSCAFRDHFHEIKELGAQLFGLSTQNTAYQLEAATRLHLPFLLLSDEHFAFTNALQLPTFELSGMVLNKRLTIVAFNGRIKHVFYPIFTPNQNASDVVDWLKQHV
jgi:peroxiredoxin